MSREDSTILKGIAILMMLFLHLFNHLGDTTPLYNIIYINDIPLVHWLTRACNPVHFYLILGGYGMYCKYEYGKDKRHVTRLLNLFYHYWIILLIAISLAYIIHGTNYLTDTKTIFLNITALHTTWNLECWFLFPYIILSFVSPWLFKMIEKIPTGGVIAGSFILFALATHCRDMYSDAIQNHVPIPFYIFCLQLPIICLTLLFPFLIGAIARKHCVFEIISENITYSKAHYPWIFTILLLALVLFRCLWAGQYFNFAYASIFIILFLQIPLHRYIRAMLLHLGRYSMDMWMIHTWICYYLFHEFIYGLHYPLLMFAVLTILSYVAAKTINMFINTIKVWSSGLHTE